MVSSVDWSPQNKLIIALTAGANAHAAHHLFPTVAHCHNSQLSLIIYDLATKNHIKFNSLTFFTMLNAHLRHLKKLGAGV